MKQFSAVLLVMTIALAIVIGPQTRAWSWGPSLICLGAASLSVLPSLLKESVVGWKLQTFAAFVVAWFTFRAFTSPVTELLEADLLLLTAAVGTFVVTAISLKDKTSETIFLWGISIILLANTIILAIQIGDPSFYPVYRSRPVTFPSGFFGHYNEAANFAAGAGFLLLGPAIFGTQGKFTRIIWGVVAAAALGSIYFTLSRGGILAAGIGGTVFGLAAVTLGLQRKRLWAKFLLIALPFAAFLVITLVYHGWSNSQQLRFGKGIEFITDDSIRFYLYGIACSCIGLHPWAGGGSRSFSWECNQFWTFREHGFGTTRPEMVHNELLQAVTDYGIVGGILITILLCWICTGGLVRLLSRSQGGALIIGALAGLASMFVQSLFSFVFHLLPGVLLLGICLACLARSSGSNFPGPKLGSFPKITLATLSLVIGLVSIAMGWKGSRVIMALAPALFHSADTLSPEGKVAAISEALNIWPQASLYESRAATLQREANKNLEAPDAIRDIEIAISDYREAIKLHPYNASSRLNLALLLSYMGDNENAEQKFREGIALEGGLEAGYKGRFRFCKHLIARGEKALRERNFDDAIARFFEARDVYEEIYKEMDWFTAERAELQVPLMIGLGMAQEGIGDKEEALKSYSEAHGGAGHYHSAVLLSQMAETKWREREPSHALNLFRRSRDEIGASLSPQTRDFKGGDEGKKKEILEYLDQRISFLTEAGIR